MIRIIIVFYIVLVPIYDHHSMAMEDPTKGESLRVLWVVSELIPGSNPQLDEEAFRGYLGQPLDMDSSSITFAGSTCADINFKKTRGDSQTLLRKKFNVSPDLINYQDRQIILIETNCTLDGFNQFFQLKDRRLVVLIQGILFIFEPNVNYRN